MDIRKIAENQGVHAAAANAHNAGIGDYDRVSAQLNREGYGPEFDAHPDWSARVKAHREAVSLQKLCDAMGYSVQSVIGYGRNLDNHNRAIKDVC